MHKEHLPPRGWSAEQGLLYDSQRCLLSPYYVHRRRGVEVCSARSCSTWVVAARRLIGSLSVQGSATRSTAHIMYDFIHNVQPALGTGSLTMTKRSVPPCIDTSSATVLRGKHLRSDSPPAGTLVHLVFRPQTWY